MSSTVRALDANEENGSTGHFRLTRELTIPNTHNLQSSCIYGKTCGWMIVCPHNCETSWCPILRRCEINKSSERVGWPSQLRNIVLSWPPKMSFSPAENENIFETTSLRDIDLWPWVRPWAEPCCNQSLSLAPVPQHLPLSISFFFTLQVQGVKSFWVYKETFDKHFGL